MIRGTTPTIKYNLTIDTSTIVDCIISFKQFNCEVFNKTFEDVQIQENVIRVSLTQEETISFTPGKLLTQIKVKTQENKVYASKMIELNVYDSLCCEII